MIKAIDVETTRSPNHFPWCANSSLVSVSIYRGDATSRTWLVDHVDGSSDTHRKIIQQIQEEIDTCDILIAHNMKFDLQWLLHIGINCSCKIYCTQVGEFTLNSFERGMKLDRLAKRYGLRGKKDRVKQYWDAGYETNEIPKRILLDYNVDDCYLAIRIFEKQAGLIKKQGLLPLFNHAMEETRVLAELEMNGMLYDADLSLEIAAEYSERMKEIEERTRDIAGRSYSGYGRIYKGSYECLSKSQSSPGESEYSVEGNISDTFNLGSGSFLSALLYGGTFPVGGIESYEYTYKDGSSTRKQRKTQLVIKLDGLGIKPLRDSETTNGYSTAADVLAKLRTTRKVQREVIGLLGEHRKLAKQNNTYFESLPKKLDERGFLHAKINQTVAQTARYSSSDPNGQNLPRGDTSRLRECIRSRFDS